MINFISKAESLILKNNKAAKTAGSKISVSFTPAIKPEVYTTGKVHAQRIRSSELIRKK